MTSLRTVTTGGLNRPHRHRIDTRRPQGQHGTPEDPSPRFEATEATRGARKPPQRRQDPTRAPAERGHASAGGRPIRNRFRGAGAPDRTGSSLRLSPEAPLPLAPPDASRAPSGSSRRLPRASRYPPRAFEGSPTPPGVFPAPAAPCASEPFPPPRGPPEAPRRPLRLRGSPTPDGLAHAPRPLHLRALPPTAAPSEGSPEARGHPQRSPAPAPPRLPGARRFSKLPDCLCVSEGSPAARGVPQRSPAPCGSQRSAAPWLPPSPPTPPSVRALPAPRGFSRSSPTASAPVCGLRARFRAPRAWAPARRLRSRAGTQGRRLHGRSERRVRRPSRRLSSRRGVPGLGASVR